MRHMNVLVLATLAASQLVVYDQNQDDSSSKFPCTTNCILKPQQGQHCVLTRVSNRRCHKSWKLYVLTSNNKLCLLGKGDAAENADVSRICNSTPNCTNHGSSCYCVASEPSCRNLPTRISSNCDKQFGFTPNRPSAASSPAPTCTVAAMTQTTNSQTVTEIQITTSRVNASLTPITPTQATLARSNDTSPLEEDISRHVTDFSKLAENRPEVTSQILFIENALKLLAIRMVENNLQQTINKGFVCNVVKYRNGEGIEVHSNRTTLFAETTRNATELFLEATELEMPFTRMKVLIQGSEKSGAKREITTLMPATPFLSVIGFEPGKNTTVDFNITFTYHLPIELLKTRLESNTSQGRIVLSKLKPTCSFVNLTLRRFSEVGCRHVYSREGSNITCLCNHTTMFAVLLTVRSVTISRGVQIASYVCETLSSLFFLITLAILIKFRTRLKSNRSEVQINLTFSLLLLHLCNLFQEVAVKNKRTCEAITVLTHFFLLSSGGWMTAEALTLLLKITKNALGYDKKKRRMFRSLNYVLGWGLPTLLVAFSASFGFMTDSYIDRIESDHFATTLGDALPHYSYCWISTKSMVRFLAVVLPMSFFWLFNFAVTIKAVHLVAKMKSKEKMFRPRNGNNDMPKNFSMNHVTSPLRALFMLFPTLGLPWIFAFLVGFEDQLASATFMYLNAIINGLQGLALFFIYCVLATEVREMISREYENFRSRCGFAEES